MKNLATLVSSLVLIPVLGAPLLGQLSEPVPLPGDMASKPLAGQKFEPYLASGNGGHLLVWLDRRGALAPTVEGDPWEVVQSDVYAMRLDAQGTPIGTPIRIDGSAYSQEAPRAAFNGTDWLIVYESRSVSSTGFYTTQDVRATRLSGSGQVLDSVALAIDTEDTETYVPCVASDGTDWAVFWTTAFTTFGRKVFADGTLGPTKAVYDPGSWHFDPEVAFAGDRYLLVWEPPIRGRFLDVDLDPIGGLLAIGQGSDAQVATDGTDFFVSYANLGTWAQILGTVVRSNGTVVTPAGQLLDGGTYLALEPAAIAWDGSGYTAAWSEYRYVFPAGPEESLLVNRFDANGSPVWGAPVVAEISTDFSVRNPMLSSLGNGQSLVGWMDNRHGTKNYYTGQAKIVDSGGSVAAQPTCTMVGPPAQMHPDLVRGPVGATLAQDVDLAVFVSFDADESRIVYQRLDGLGNALDPEPVLIAGGTDTYTDPTAAWNGTEWLVVWEDSVGGTGNGGALAARVLPDGTVIDATPLAIVEGNDPDVGALASADGDFLIVTTQLTSNDIRTLHGQRVSSAGELLGSVLFLGTNYALSPSVEGFDDRWIVIWHRKPSHDDPADFLQARLVFPDGTASAVLDPSNSTTDEVLGDVAVDGSLATFVWSDGTDVRARQMDKSGAFLGDPAGVVVSSAADEQTAPTITFEGSKAFVTWVDDRIHGIFEPGIGDLYGARLDGALTVLDPDGVAIAADPNAPEGEAALSGRLGKASVLYPAMLPEVGQWRVSIGGFPEPGTPVVSFCTAGSSASGCAATLSASGSASATAASGFVLTASNVEGLKDGLFFFGSSGRQANPWGNGTSYQCVVPPVRRAGLLIGSGTTGQCDGTFSQDLNALWCPTCPKPQKNLGAGAVVQAQLWYRDPQNTSNQTTSMSDAIEFVVGQ